MSDIKEFLDKNELIPYGPSTFDPSAFAPLRRVTEEDWKAYDQISMFCHGLVAAIVTSLILFIVYNLYGISLIH